MISECPGFVGCCFRAYCLSVAARTGMHLVTTETEIAPLEFRSEQLVSARLCNAARCEPFHFLLFDFDSDMKLLYFYFLWSTFPDRRECAEPHITGDRQHTEFITSTSSSFYRLRFRLRTT